MNRYFIKSDYVLNSILYIINWVVPRIITVIRPFVDNITVFIIYFIGGTENEKIIF